MDKKQQILELLKLHYGYNSLRQGQEQAINNIINKKSTLVIMPTGGGKSLCYQLPALVLDGVTLVVSPLISLMKDQVDSLNKIGIPATFINSSLSQDRVELELNKVREGYYKLIYVAPERFYSRDFINTLNSIKVELFAIDEAHCISQWGHDFRPSYTKLASAIEQIGNPTIIALTATATPEVKEDIIKQLNLKNPEYIITGFARPNLQFGVVQANDIQRSQLILDLIWKTNEGSGIIYAGTRKKVEDTLLSLQRAGIEAIGYHGGMEAEERKRVQENFMNNRARFVVATNAFGMGIDKSDIRFVIHYSLPGTLEAYYQEVGRAGRDGKHSFCVLFYHPKDRRLHEFFIKGDNPPASTIRELYTSLTNESSNTILATYSKLKEELSDDVPEMAIGTSLKILEREGYIQRANEKTGNAHFQLLTNFEDAVAKLGSRAKKSQDILLKLYENYASELNRGLEVNFEIISSMIGANKDSIVRVLKKLANLGIAEYSPPFRGTEINILKRIDPDELQIDFSSLKNKLTQAYSKLNKMEDFIYHLDCRQKYILNYFGDDNPYTCGKCDNCLADLGYKRKHKAPDKEYLTNTIKTAKQEFKEKKMFNTKLTQLVTLEHWKNGLDTDEIAKERDLKEQTISNHVVYLIEKDLIKKNEIDKIVTTNKQKKIIKAIEKIGGDKLKPIKEDLGKEYSYNDIKFTRAVYKKH